MSLYTGEQIDDDANVYFCFLILLQARSAAKFGLVVFCRWKAATYRYIAYPLSLSR